MSRWPEDGVDGDEVVWTDGHEGSIWISNGEVVFILDKENYEARMEPDEALAFASALVQAAHKARTGSRTELVPKKKWDVWTDESTGAVMLSRIEGDRVLVRELHSIHEPGSMSKSEFKERFGR